VLRCSLLVTPAINRLFGCEDVEGQDGTAPGSRLFDCGDCRGEDVPGANIRPRCGITSPPKIERTGAILGGTTVRLLHACARERKEVGAHRPELGKKRTTSSRGLGRPARSARPPRGRRRRGRRRRSHAGKVGARRPAGSAGARPRRTATGVASAGPRARERWRCGSVTEERRRRKDKEKEKRKKKRLNGGPYMSMTCPTFSVP
jgi:hypothetical protein